MANQTEAGVRLKSLLRLPAGWDYGRGGPLSREAYGHATEALNILSSLGATDFDVVPGVEDGAVIVGYRGNKSAEVHCLANGRYEIVHEEGDVSESLENLHLDELICALEGYGWQSPRFYASCTRSVTYHESDVTVAWPLKIRVVGVSPLSAPRVLPRVKRAPATTSGSSTTRTPAATRQSSGEFQSVPFLVELA